MTIASYGDGTAPKGPQGVGPFSPSSVGSGQGSGTSFTSGSFSFVAGNYYLFTVCFYSTAVTISSLTTSNSTAMPVSAVNTMQRVGSIFSTITYGGYCVTSGSYTVSCTLNTSCNYAYVCDSLGVVDPSTAVVQSVSAGAKTATLSAFANGGDSTYVVAFANNTMTPSGGLSALTANTANSFVKLESMYQTPGTTTPAFTTSGLSYGIVAFEIKGPPIGSYGSVIGTTRSVTDTINLTNVTNSKTGYDAPTYNLTGMNPTDVYILTYYSYSTGYALSSMTASNGTITNVLNQSNSTVQLVVCTLTGGSGNSTITLTGAGPSFFGTLIIDKITGCTSTPVVQSAGSQITNPNGATSETLSTFASTNNAVYVTSFSDRGSSTPFSASSGYTMLSNAENTYLTNFAASAFKLGQDLAPSMLCSSNSGWYGAFACELQFRTDTLNVPPALRTLSTTGIGA